MTTKNVVVRNVLAAVMAAFLPFLFNACGGHGPTSSSTPPPPPLNSVTFLNERTGATLKPNVVQISGRQVHAELAVFQTRDTTISGADPTGTTTMIPIGPGYDATFIQQLNFVWGRQVRPAGTVYIKIAANLEGARNSIEQAASDTSSELGWDFVVSDNPPAGAMVANMSVDPTRIPGNSVDTWSIDINGDTIVGATVLFVNMQSPRDFPNLVMHTLGGVLGLGEPSAPCLMNHDWTHNHHFTIEKQVVEDYKSRRNGTKAPDDDR